jgi:PAS domain S-box-containing protein
MAEEHPGRDREASLEDELVESVATGLFVVDVDWRVARVNRAAEQLLGASRAVLIGAVLWDAVPLEARVEQAMRRAMDERVVHSASGREGWLQFEAHPIDGGGLAIHLRSVERTWSLRLDQLPVAALIADRELRIVDWNPAAERTFGYGRAEVLGRPADEVLARSGRGVGQDLLATLEGGGHAEASSVGECRARDGRMLRCEWNATALGADDGELVAVLITAQDITAHHEAEQRLRRSESLLVESQRVAKLGSWSLDLRTRQVTWSEEHYRLLGLEPQEGPMPADHGSRLVHPDDLPDIVRLFAEAEQHHRPFETYWRAFHTDGSLRYEHSRCQIELDQGQPIRMFGITQDITEQKKAELALRESEAKFRTLAEASPAIIWFLDQAANALYVNRRGAEYFGISEEEVYGGRWPELIHPEDAAGYLAGLLAAVEGRRPYEGRARVHRRDGVWRWMESRALPHFGEDGRYLGHVGHSLDITEHLELTAFLRQSEVDLAAELAGMARLQEVSNRLVQTGDSTSLLQEIVDAAIAITAADMGNVQLFKPDTGELEIVASRGLSGDFLSFFARVDERRGSCGLAMHSGERVIVEDVTMSPLFDGSELDALTACGVRAVQSTPLISRTGQLVGVLSTHYRSPCRPAGRDLHVVDLLARQAADWIERRNVQDERERLLERERQARAESERAARLKDEFLATLSHELRTPLSAILGWADVLRESVFDSHRVLRGVDVIYRNARAQAQLIEDLLDLSRVVAGKMRLSMERVALPAVVDAAIEAVRPAAEARGIQVLSSVEPIEAIRGDSARLQQILWNLLSNAVKFTSTGGRVDLTLKRVGDDVEVRVTDTGKGMSADFLPHAFERFRQADSSVVREHGGLGIGLALVKELAELHGGEVTADSPGEGMGSTFTLHLPLTGGQEDREQPLRPTGAMTADPALEGIKVLVVDDEPDALEIIQHILEARHVEVYTFGSVDGALAALDSQQFDVLLSDIGMPRRDGYDFIAEVRRRGITTPAAALTAFARSEDRTRAFLSGFQAHLAKPLETSELVATVAALSGRIVAAR